MRRRLLVIVAIMVIFSTACQSPTLSALLAPSSQQLDAPASARHRQTARPPTTPTATVEFNVVIGQLAADAAIGIAPDADLIADTRRALAAFMNAHADRQQPLDRQAVTIDELRTHLHEVANEEAVLMVRDADGDQRLDLLVTLPLSGLPAFVVRHQPDGFVAYQVPRPAGRATDGPVTIDRVEDLNADGIPEIVLTSRIAADNATNILISIARWDGEAFALLLEAGIEGASQPAEWEFVQQDARQVLVTRCAARGVYDDDTLPHLTLTRVFDWRNGELVLSQIALDPPETLRQQVNSAEAAFRQGRLERALAAFRAISNTAGVYSGDPTLEADTQAVDWLAYAHFRIGELEAIRGNEAAARAAMQQVQAAGSTIGGLATTFLDAYSTDDPVRALASLQRVNLAERMQAPDANLVFPMNARDILYPGAVVAAHLNVEPNAARGSGEVLTTALRNLGLDVAGSAIVDLDGDGHAEVVTVINEQQVGKDATPTGHLQTLWLVSRTGSGWWAQPLESAPEVMLTATVPAPEQGQRAVIYQAEPLSSGSPRTEAIGWDGSAVQRFDAPDGEELVPALRSNATFECQVP